MGGGVGSVVLPCLQPRFGVPSLLRRGSVGLHCGAMSLKTTLRPTRRRSAKHTDPVLFLVWTPARGAIDQIPAVVSGQGLQLGREHATAGTRVDEDPRMSRLHAELYRMPGGLNVQIVDRQSSNGTFVNGESIDKAELQDGDVLRVGDTFFVFRHCPRPPVDAPVAGLLGRAPAIGAARRHITTVASTQANVLLLGESGTGKGVSARAIHQLSGRMGDLVVLNCSAIPETLAESQLFGHKKGAFTGADRDHPGVFRAAKGGTLFLDEVGDLPASVQAKLLVAIEEHVVTPVGSVTPVGVDVRLVAATNASLLEAVDTGRFRGDLWARLSDFVIELPPLRDRREDIAPLFAGALPSRAPDLEPDLVETLLNYHWPFNVRELLKTANELAIRGAGQDLLTVELVSTRLAPRTTPPEAAHATRPDGSQAKAKPLPPVPTRDELVKLLSQHGGVLADVGRATGRSRRQVRRWVEQFQIDLDEFRK